MTRSMLLAGAAMAAALAVSVPSVTPQASAAGGDFNWTGRIAAGQTVDVYGVNGGIDAHPGKGDLEVTAVKKFRRSNPDTVTVKVVEHAGGVTVCALYPGQTCEAGHGIRGRSEVRDNDVSVDFDIAVPSGVKTRLRTVNGGIEAVDLDAEADAETVNGGVTVATRGVARAETVNGSITASMGQADWTGELELETVNGGIRVNLPEGTGADVDAETVNGSISSDFPLEVRGKHGPKHATGRIGEGGRRLSLSTVNGGIEIRKH